MTPARGDYPGERWLPNTPDGPTVTGLAAGDWATVGGLRYYECLDATPRAARWREGHLESRSRVFNVPGLDNSAAALTAVGASVTVSAATVLHYAEINLDNFTVVTNVNVMQGTAVGNGNMRVFLYDAAGSHLAESAVAGLETADADTFLVVPLTAPITLPPGRYFGGVMLDNTTDEIQCVEDGAPYGICEAEAAHEFEETGEDITTVATGFTADVAPIFFLD